MSCAAFSGRRVPETEQMTEKFEGSNNRGKVLSFVRDSAFYAKRGDAKRAQNDPVSAVSMYAEALELDPYDLDTRLAAAEVLTDMSRFNDSNRLIIPFMHVDEEFRRESFCIAGFNFLGLGENEGARTCFNRFFALTDEISERTDAMLDALDMLDSLESDTEPILKDASLIGRDDKVRRAFIAVDCGEFGQAVTMLRALRAEYPSDTEILYKLALSCLCTQNYEESGKYLDELLEINADDWGALGMKLMCAVSLKNEVERSRLIKKLSACESEDPETLLRVNGALFESGAFEGALTTAKRLVRLLPYDRLTNHRLGISYMALKDHTRAGDVYDKLVRIDRADHVAKYYRSACREAAEDPESAISKLPLPVHYQLPLPVILDEIKSVLQPGESGTESIIERWRNDPEYREKIRWAFSLYEFTTSRSLMELMGFLGDERAELQLRELLADVDVSRQTKMEALGVLKRMGAEEPFFAYSDGTLLEGRVNLIDLSNVSIPKNYRDIFPRIGTVSEKILSPEVMSAAGNIVEKFLMCLEGEFPPITKAQSEALSAAVELLACERCDIMTDPNILEKYSVTERRLMNALDRVLKTIIEKDRPDDPENGGEQS